MGLWERLAGRVQKSQTPNTSKPLAPPAPALAKGLTVNSDGTLTDPEAGLMWQAVDDGIERIQEDAFICCSELELGGFNDWRLPTLEEFEVLRAALKASGLKVDVDRNLTSNQDYWTATQGSQADTVYIADGTTMFRTNRYLTKAVRTITYRPRPLHSPQWSSDQLELAQMLKEFIQKTGRVHGMDLEKKVGKMGPTAAPLFRRLLEVDLNGDTGQGVIMALKGMDPAFALPIVSLALTSTYGGVRNPAIYYMQFHPTKVAKALAKQRLKSETREDFCKDLRSVIES